MADFSVNCETKRLDRDLIMAVIKKVTKYRLYFANRMYTDIDTFENVYEALQSEEAEVNFKSQISNFKYYAHGARSIIADIEEKEKMLEAYDNRVLTYLTGRVFMWTRKFDGGESTTADDFVNILRALDLRRLVKVDDMLYMDGALMGRWESDIIGLANGRDAVIDNETCFKWYICTLYDMLAGLTGWSLWVEMAADHPYSEGNRQERDMRRAEQKVFWSEMKRAGWDDDLTISLPEFQDLMLCLKAAIEEDAANN